MRFYVTLFLLGALVAHSVADELSPEGIGNPFRVSPDEVRTAFLDGQSFARDEVIEKYARLLVTSNAEVQSHAAWALGRIQSAKAIEVLLSCRTRVTNELVLRLVSESVRGQFSDLLLPSEDVRAKPAGLLDDFVCAYGTNGYEGLLLSIFHRVSGTEELCEMFVRDITEMYDPKLTHVLLRIYPDIYQEGLKNRVELGILNCSGIDVRRLGVAAALSIVEKPDALAPEYVVERYLEYFRSMGYMGSDSDVFWKVIMTSDMKIHRLMAYRGLQAGRMIRANPGIRK